MFVCRYIDDSMDDFAWGSGLNLQDAFDDMLVTFDLTEEDLVGDPQFFQEVEVKKTTRTYWDLVDSESDDFMDDEDEE